MLLLFLITLWLFYPSLIFAQGCEKFIDNDCAELEWQLVHTGAGEVAAIAIAPSNPSIVYAGLENNAHPFYKSTDGGTSWKRLTGPGDHAKDIAISPKNADKAYVATSEVVYTTDKSITPTSRSQVSRAWPGADAIDIRSSNRNPGPSVTSFSTIEIFLGDDHIIYTAVKGGGEIQGFGDTNPEIFKTRDGGRTWESIHPKVEEVNVLAIDPAHQEVIYIGSGDGIYKSSNSGSTIERLYRSSDSIISLELYTNLLLAASKSEVVKSTDGGKTWEEITGSLQNIHRLQASRSHPDIVYAATFEGVFKSVDGGKTWMDKNSRLQAKNIQIVEVHPTNPNIAFIGTSSLWSSARSENEWRTGLYAGQGIFRTTDGGDSWQRVDSGFFEHNIEEVATNPAKPYEAWFAGQASMGAYKTEDGGQHWRLTQTPTFHYPMRIKFSVQNPQKVYATGWQEGGPFSVSEDGGITWEFIEGGTFFSGINRGKDLYTPAAPGPATIHLHGLAVDPQNDQIVYAGSIYDANSPTNFPLKGAHLWKSADSGKTWQESDEGFPHQESTSVHDLVIDPRNTKVLYAATTRHESQKAIGIYKSIDAGKTWKAANGGLTGEALDVGAIVVHPTRTLELIAATHGGIYKSTTGGTQWQKKESASSFDVEYVKDEPDTIYASTDEGVLKSTNFGDTWYKVSYGLPNGEGQGIGVDPTGKVIYAAVRDKGLYVARREFIPEANLPTELGRGRGFLGRGEPQNFPDFGFGREGDDDEESERNGESRIPAGGQRDPPNVEDIATVEFCEQQSWPPSCSFIPDDVGREICERCKEREEAEGRNVAEETREQPAVDVERPETLPREGLFDKIVRFFSRIFGAN